MTTSITGNRTAWPWVDHSQRGGVTLLLAGDTNLQNRSNPAEVFAHVLPTLKAADVLFGHLESPFSMPSSDPAAPDIPHKNGWRHSDPAMVEGFVAAGFAAVGCASNVMYGRQTILKSLSTLDASGIGHCGAGRNWEEARRPAVVERRGVRFGFLSYTSVFWPVGHAAGPDTPGVATIKAITAYQPSPRALEMPGAPPLVITMPDPIELGAMERDVRRLREQVDVMVISCHWGVSSSNLVMDYQRAVGRAAINAGADIVIGHHPHVVQGIEVWQGRPIFYSLGNFAYDWEKMRGKNLDGLLVCCIIRDHQLVHVSFVPVRRNSENLVEMLNPADGAGHKTVEQVRILSAEMNTELSVQGSAVVVGGIAVPTK